MLLVTVFAVISESLVSTEGDGKLYDGREFTDSPCWGCVACVTVEGGSGRIEVPVNPV